MTRLLYPHERAAIAEQIQNAVDEWCVKTYDDGHRTHLGASLIGHECKRYLWYTFRWVKHVVQSGQQYRLFNRGHKEEARFIEWLRGIGFQIWDVDAEGNQTRVSGVGGHYGGSLDSVGKAPEWLKLLADIGPILVEYKTHNDKSFNKLKKETVKRAKHQHWVQMCTYGSFYKFKYALYCAINKDTDETYFEIVELDWNVGLDHLRVAEEVIGAVRPPVRIQENALTIPCKWCDFADVCHKGKAYEVNCRSCQFATAVKDKQWHCGFRNLVIPPDVIPVGCSQWRPVGRNG